MMPIRWNSAWVRLRVSEYAGFLNIKTRFFASVYKSLVK